MIRSFRNHFLTLVCLFIAIHVGIASAQGSSSFENARQLNKQEIIDLISNKKISYRITVGSKATSVVSFEMMQITFTKTDETAGDLYAFSSKSSSAGKWHVNDNARLIRQYDKVSWGSKPFAVAVFENNGKYYWKIGEEFQELFSIE